jgi:hypothetical protein
MTKEDQLKEKLRAAVANYMKSEGCGCCGDHDSHRKHEAALGELLDVPKYSDGSGYDFSQFQTK